MPGTETRSERILEKDVLDGDICSGWFNNKDKYFTAHMDKRISLYYPAKERK